MKIFIFLILLLINLNTHALEKVSISQVFLYQPNAELQRYIKNQFEFSQYISDIKKTIINIYNNEKLSKEDTGSIVVAVNNKKELRIWYVDIEISTSLKQKIFSKVSLLSIPEINNGPVIFAYGLNLLGATDKNISTPIPSEWKEKAKTIKQPIIITELVKLVW